MYDVDIARYFTVNECRDCNMASITSCSANIWPSVRSGNVLVTAKS